MLGLLLVSILAMVLYLTLMAVNYGIQPSISDNYYVARHRWTFTSTMLVQAFLMALVMITIAPENIQFAGFFAGAGLAFVGVAAAYKESITNTIHTFGAVISGIMSLVWTLNICLPISLLAILVALFILIRRGRNTIYWVEVTAFAMVYITSIIKLV